MSKRPKGLVAIVFYKIFTAFLLGVISVSLLLSLKYEPNLEQFYESLTLAGKRGVIAFIFENIWKLNPKTLLFSGLGAGAYAVVTTIEAVGLWYQKVWARWLVLGMVTIGIPPEIFELVRGFSLLKMIIFVLNIAVFVYLLREFPKK